MTTITKFIDSIFMEGEDAIRQKDAELYNFLPAGHRLARKMEELYGVRCVAPIIGALKESHFDNPANRILLYTLLRLIPTKQTVYELNLTKLLPNWRISLLQNPQIALPSEFELASEISETTDITYPDGFIEVINKSVRSKRLDIALAGLKVCENIGTQDLLNDCLEIANISNGALKNKAILIAARISHSNTPEFQELKTYVHNPDLPIDLRICAFEAFLKTPRKNDRDVLLEFLQAETGNNFLQTTHFINAILDTGRQDIARWINNALSNLRIESLPQSTLHRVMRSPAVSKDFRQQAFARLHSGLMKLSVSATNTKFALLAHRNSGLDAAFIGHVGIVKDENANEMIDCTVGRDPQAVQPVSFSEWRDGKECWGFREDHDDPVNLRNALDRAEEIASWRTEYDGSHNNQKGQWFKPSSCAPKYWEADCVGFTEHCYEYASGNPTPDEFENDAGWPLTPREQRDHMRKIADC